MKKRMNENDTRDPRALRIYTDRDSIMAMSDNNQVKKSIKVILDVAEERGLKVYKAFHMPYVRTRDIVISFDPNSKKPFPEDFDFENEQHRPDYPATDVMISEEEDEEGFVDIYGVELDADQVTPKRINQAMDRYEMYSEDTQNVDSLLAPRKTPQKNNNTFETIKAKYKGKVHTIGLKESKTGMIVSYKGKRERLSNTVLECYRTRGKLNKKALIKDIII